MAKKILTESELREIVRQVIKEELSGMDGGEMMQENIGKTETVTGTEFNIDPLFQGEVKRSKGSRAQINVVLEIDPMVADNTARAIEGIYEKSILKLDGTGLYIDEAMHNRAIQVARNKSGREALNIQIKGDVVVPMANAEGQSIEINRG